jgi:outer membrane protein OmpA-like peptidoglycan-associated protein
LPLGFAGGESVPPRNREEAMKSMIRWRAIGALPVLVSVGLGACSSMNKTQKGAVIGAGAGAAAGAVIGKQAGSTAKGAIIGAVVGGTAGAIIGSQMDKQAKELAAEIPGAKIERVGEGLLVTFDSGLLFAFDSDVIEGNARTNLGNLAASLREYPNTDVVIVGHTDSIGSNSYNQSLSQRRASSAATYLASSGVPRDRIDATGKGETEPVADNATDGGRQQNRRVEVAIFASEEYRKQLQRRNGS